MEPFTWNHTWDGYEMELFIGKDAVGQEKIFSRVSKLVGTKPEQQKEPLYEREICLLNPEIIRGLDRETWESKQLRWLLDSYPDLIQREQVYLQDWEKAGK